MDQLVVRALQEGRVNSDDGFQAVARHAGSERYGVLLGDRNVEIAIGKPSRIFDEPGAFAHRGRDRDDVLVEIGHVAHPLAEHLRVAWPRRLFLEDYAALRVERTRPMPLDRIRFRGRIAFAFARYDVQELGSFEIAQILERGNERTDVMAVDRADVVEAERFEDRARQHHALHMFFGAPRELPYGRQA